jgi:FMN phosphatase YigB (HAD superfamily)
MALSLAEYADFLDQKKLIWPQVPAAKSMKATPSVALLPGIRCVLWDVYGTLLRISDGHFSVMPNDDVRLQVALDKTIHEFNMWNHMYRRPGPPWQSLIGLYQSAVERQKMAGCPKGDFPEVNLVEVWRGLIDRLFDKEYTFDEAQYGGMDEFSEKVAYFFHCNLQATEPRDGAVKVMSDLSTAGVLQGFLTDGQSFTLVQTLRAMALQGILPPLYKLFKPQTLILSTDLGLRKPSRSLFSHAVTQLRSAGIPAKEVLHVSCRLPTDLVPARAAGFKTALLVAEKSGLEVTSEMLRDPATKPDRLITHLSQIRDVVGA